MKKNRLILLLVLGICLLIGVGIRIGTASKSNQKVKDGQYQISVSLQGGSGRASVLSPAELSITNGKMMLTLVMSSPNYDYVIVNEEKFAPQNAQGNSVFIVPVETLQEPLSLIADTTAMSVPHEIEYTVVFEPSSLEKTEK